jgi:hypothetical protein
VKTLLWNGAPIGTVDASAFQSEHECSTPLAEAMREATERLSREYSTLVNRLCGAMSLKHGAVELKSSRLPDGTWCEWAEPTGAAIDLTAVPGLAEQQRILAAEFYLSTSLAPEDCAVMMRPFDNGTPIRTLRAAYERRPV